ncbi:hypothetical protein ACMAZF_12675 [Psychrobium sp. nBUS_13]|uniref:hypothetical protein n=1 Tax=Psychrobium sp. nBUS_13 TaxID=3395319 RepID=UPI003EBDC8E3
MKNIYFLFLFLFLFLLNITQAIADEVSFNFKFIESTPKFGLILVENNKKIESDTIIDQKNKKFIKKFFVSNNGGEISIKNSDKYGHNVYINDRINSFKYDSGLIKQGDLKKTNLNIDDNRMIRVGCKIHPRMKSYIIKSKSNNYKEILFSEKNKEHKFKLDRINENENTFKVFIPNLNPITFTAIKGELKELEIIKKNEIIGFLSISRI